MGAFIKLYGRDNVVKLIERALAGDSRVVSGSAPGGAVPSAGILRPGPGEPVDPGDGGADGGIVEKGVVPAERKLARRKGAEEAARIMQLRLQQGAVGEQDHLRAASELASARADLAARRRGTASSLGRVPQRFSSSASCFGVNGFGR